MARRKKSSGGLGGLSSLGSVFSTRGRKKSSGGLGGLGKAFSRRKGRKGKSGLADYAGFGKSKKGGKGMMGMYNSFYGKKPKHRRAMSYSAFRERMTRTEYLTLKDEMDRTIENDQMLTSSKSYQQLVDNMPWYKRVLVLARNRLRSPFL